MDSSNLVPAVVVLGVLFGLTILVAVPILIYCYMRKRKEAGDLQQQMEIMRGYPDTNNKKPISQINSLPCRLKKSASSNGGGNRSAGESGVYDMTDMSTLSDSGLHSKSQPITASFTDSKGDLQKLFLYGELSPDDSLVVKSVLARHIQILQEEEVTYTPIPTTGSFDPGFEVVGTLKNVPVQDQECQRVVIAAKMQCQTILTAKNNISDNFLELVDDTSHGLDESVMTAASLDDIHISGLEPGLSYENEGYRHDEYENNNHAAGDSGTSRRKRVKKSLSALSNRVKQRFERQLTKSSIVGTTINTSLLNTYKTAVIGHAGGEITLDSGVKLSIPPNALSEKTEIILGVSFDPTHLPQLGEDEGLLTPVIFCQPSGLEFRVPATLTMPHCALQVQENWRINIMRSQTDVDSPDTDWKSLQIGEYESRAFYKHTVDICINHFTMYCVSGISKEKRTAYKQKKLIALARENSPTSYSVYCVNNYKQKQKDQVESSSGSMNIEGSGQSVKLCVEGISDSETEFSNNQQISYDDVWHDNLNPLSLVLRDQDTNSPAAECELCGWQIGNTSPRHKVTIQAKLNKHRPPSNGAVPGSTKKRRIFPETLKWDMMLLLDPTHSEGNDWRKFAEEIGLSHYNIQELEDSTSPTKELLKIWEEKSHGCIRSFVATAVKINRLDVAEKVEEHIGTLYLETLPNHKCNQHC